MFEKRSLNWKMRMAFTVSAVSLAVVGYCSFYGLQQVEQKYEHVANVNLPNSLLVETMKSSSDKAMSLMIQSAIIGNDEKELKRLSGRYEDTIKKFDEAVAEYKKVPFAPGEAEIFHKMMKTWETVSVDLNKGRDLAMIAAPEQKYKFQEFYMSTKVKDARFQFYKDLEELFSFS